MNVEQSSIQVENREMIEKILTTCIHLVSLYCCDVQAISITLHGNAGGPNSPGADCTGQGNLQYQEIVLDVPIMNTLTYVLRK